VPAAAVIPAPVAYIKAVAVKKLVVGYQCVSGPVCLLAALTRHRRAPKYRLAAFNRAGPVDGPFFGGARWRPATLP
jgi:hypothetical protein